MKERCLSNRFILISVAIMMFLTVELIFFKVFIDFDAKTKILKLEEIKHPKIINLAISKKRRDTYERMIDTKFNGELFFTKTKDITFTATHGKFDLIFIELDENNQEIQTIPAMNISAGAYKLKDNVRYKVYDKRYPEFYYYYKYNPTDIIWRKRHMNIGEFGCITSHLRAINQIANGDDEYSVIFEDDLLLKDNFIQELNKMLKKTPNDFDILKLDGVHNGKSGRRLAWLKSRIRFGANKYFYNASADDRKIGLTTAYIVSKKFAKKLTKLLQHKDLNGADGTADVFLFMVLPRKYNFNNMWIAKDWLVSQRSLFTHSGSDIGNIAK